MLEILSPFVYVILIAVIAGLLFYKKLNPRFIRVLVFLLVITLTIELGAVWFIRTFRIKNHVIYNFFTPIQFFLIWLLFYKAQTGSTKNFLTGSLIFLLLFFLINILWWQGALMFNSYTFMLSGALITFYTLSHLVTLYNDQEVEHFTRNPMFWICIGILFYFPPNIIVTGFIYELYKYSHELSKKLYQINKILNILMYFFFLISIIIAARKRKPIPNNAA